MIQKKGERQRTIDLTEEEVRRLIKLKLEKKIAQLPYGFWRCERGEEHAKIAIKYLIEEHLNLEIKDIPKKISGKTFHETGLFRILVEFYDSSYFKAIDSVYPGQFKPWEFSKGMTGIWDGSIGRKRALKAIEFIIRDLNLSEEEIPKRITYQTFIDYGLGGMLQTLFNSSPYLAINALFPDKYKPWEFSVKKFWQKASLQTAREATKWLIEEKLGLKKEETDKVLRKHFIEFNLGQMLRYFYNNSYRQALEDFHNNF